MADRDLAGILNSGELTSIFLGGVTTDDRVIKLGELTATNTDFDNALTSLTALTVQDALVELSNVGLGHMSLGTPYTGGQILGTTPVKLSAFDTIDQNINGAVTPTVDTNEATPAHLFTIDKTGLYRIYGTIEAEYASAASVSMQLYINGVAAGKPVTLQGRGTGKPVLFSYIDITSLTATDYLEIYAYSDAASTSTIIKSSSVIVERMPLA